MSSSTTYSNPGSFTFTPDIGITSVTVETWGAGGGADSSGSGSSRTAAAGGGGYSIATVTITDATATVVVGAGGIGGNGTGLTGPGGTNGGDSYFYQVTGGTGCLAKGGLAGVGSAIGAGGASSAGIGSTKFSGGNGGLGGTGDAGGGGGSSAGTSSNGTVGADATAGAAGLGGVAPTGGGDGGKGGENIGATAGQNGVAPGGGGGSANAGSSAIGGSGATGKVIVTWTPVTASGGTPVSGYIPLFVSATCGAALRPSGDMGHNPSGHFFNFLGSSGNQTYYTYINSDPTSVVTDTDYITIVQSGHKNRTDRIFYSNTSNQIKTFNISTATTTSFVSNAGTFKYNKEGFVYYYNTVGNSLYRFRETNFSDSGNPQLVTTYTQGYDIAIDNKRRKIYTPISNTLYRYNYDGTSVETCDLSPYAIGMNFDSVAVDTENNIIYVGGNTSSATYVEVIDGSGFTRQCSLNGLLTGTPMPIQSLSVNPDSGNLYLAFNNGLWKSSPLGCSGTWSQVAGTSFQYAESDWIKNKLYIASGTKVLSTNVDLTSPSDVGLSDGSLIDISVDGPGYKSSIDFDLGDLASGFGSTTTQQATNVWVDIRGQEMYDYTNVYAQIISRNKQNLIWENYPESCAQFFVASGAITQQIGLTGSAINLDYNNASDWNDATLRLYFYSNNFRQPSGNFRLYSAQVTAYCSGVPVAGSRASGNLTFVITGNAITPPSASGGTGSSGASGIPNANFIPLFLQGNTIFTESAPSGITLTTWGQSNASGYIPLYISGSYLNSSMTLYTSGPVVGSGINNDTFIPFYTYATTNSGVSKNIPLIMVGDQSAQGYYPLFLKNADGVSLSGIQPLYIGGGTNGIAAQTTLYLNNTYASSGNDLYIQGRGYGDTDPTLPGGGIPFQASFPLYMHRTNDVKVMPLFLCNTTTPSGIPLYTMGAYTQTSGIPLVMPTTYGGISGIPPLFVSGW